VPYEISKWLLSNLDATLNIARATMAMMVKVSHCIPCHYT
jgi:hypothetical protein